MKPNYLRRGMSISVIEIDVPSVQQLRVNASSLEADLSDGRSVSVPLAWFPRLLHATPAERNNWRLIGEGEGIHWPDLDEDISVEALLAGRRSMENRESIAKWLRSRN
jgi:hypothetical protein